MEERCYFAYHAVTLFLIMRLNSVCINLIQSCFSQKQIHEWNFTASSIRGIRLVCLKKWFFLNACFVFPLSGKSRFRLKSLQFIAYHKSCFCATWIEMSKGKNFPFHAWAELYIWQRKTYLRLVYIFSCRFPCFQLYSCFSS